MPPDRPVSRLLPVLILLAALAPPSGSARAAEFSRGEWENPGRSGSILWLKNGRGRAVALDSLFVRSDGLRPFREVAFGAGGRRVHFAVTGEGRGGWRRLVPLPPRRRLRVPARDSLMLSRFECGRDLRPGRPARWTVAEFALDLKVVDDRGDTAVVKLFQLEPRYDIPESPARASGASAPDPRAPRAPWGTLEVTQGDLNAP